MFLRQKFIFLPFTPRGGWGLGVLSGVAAVLLMVCEFWAVTMVIFWGRENFGKKARIQKNVTLYNFFTFFQGLISCRFRPIFGGYEPARGRKGLYITLISAYFRCFLIWASFGEVSSVIFGVFSVLPAVLRSVVGVESVKLRQAVRRSGYIYVFLGILSIASYFLSNYRKSKKHTKVSFYIKKQAKITTSIPFYP